MRSWTAPAPRVGWLAGWLLGWLLTGLGGAAAHAEELANPALEAARIAKVRALKRDVIEWAQGPWAAQHKDDLLKSVAALASIGGVDAARAVLEALHSTDADVRDRACALIEKVHDPSLVEPLAALVEHKDLRRDYDLHRRIAHALTVTADVKALPALTALVGSPDAAVVAAAADGLAAFPEAKVAQKREGVQRLIDLYESTWNLMNSVRPEDRIASKIAADKWEIFGRSLRHALQALTAQQLARPHEWRRWWNDHKKDDVWRPGSPPEAPVGRPR